MDIGLLSAFAGGMLALLSPCAALLIPAFFASTIGSGPRLILHGAIYYVGLLTILVPIGIGAGAIGTLLATRRELLVALASVLLVALGIAQLLGYGFDPVRMLPGGARLQRSVAASSGWAKTFLLGAASGIAGFCAGPILGAVITIAAGLGDPLSAGLLLAVYGAGMVVPLQVIAAGWRRLGERGRGILRGQMVVIAGRDLHTTSLITGVLIIAVGILFWITNGLIGVPELLPVDSQSWLQETAAGLSTPTVDIAIVIVIAAAIIVIWARRRSGPPTER